MLNLRRLPSVGTIIIVLGTSMETIKYEHERAVLKALNGKDYYHHCY
jgi:hypothetical protein